MTCRTEAEHSNRGMRLRVFGEYRTRRFVLEAWERLHAQGLMPEAYDKNKAENDDHR